MDSVESVQYESAYETSYTDNHNVPCGTSYTGPLICILIPLKEIDLDVFYQLCVQNQE
jgi:hypothetical protein